MSVDIRCFACGSVQGVHVPTCPVINERAQAALVASPLNVSDTLALPCNDCGKGHSMHTRVWWRDEQGRRCCRFECPTTADFSPSAPASESGEK